jgi:molybdopterin-guanine dinucleotide biosynthesis protein A
VSREPKASAVGGLVLCGGRSSRMGRPKAWLPVGGETMLQRVVRILSGTVSPVVVVAAPGQDIPELPADVRIVRDVVEGCGPLAGLAAGLAALGDEVEAVYLSACDVPLLTPAFVRRVVDSLSDFPAAVPEIDGFPHPLAAVYRTSVLALVRDRLSRGEFALHPLFDAVPTRRIRAGEFADVDPELQSLRNVNTPEEYAAVLDSLR